MYHIAENLLTCSSPSATGMMAPRLGLERALYTFLTTATVSVSIIALHSADSATVAAYNV